MQLHYQCASGRQTWCHATKGKYKNETIMTNTIYKKRQILMALDMDHTPKLNHPIYFAIKGQYMGIDKEEKEMLHTFMMCA